MQTIQIGAYGQTVFSLLPSEHLGGSRLQLRSREGSIRIGRREIEIIAGLAEIFGVECDQPTINVLTDRMSGHQMEAADSLAHDNPIPKHEQCSNPRCARYMPGYRPLCTNCKKAFKEAR